MALLGFNAFVSALIFLQAVEIATPDEGRIPSSSAAISEPDVSVDILRRTNVGKRKAGFFCAPNGRFRIEDFFASDGTLKLLVLAALKERELLHINEKIKSISLKHMNASLCARDYISDKNFYSGEVSFAFVITSHDGIESVEKVDLKVGKQQSRSEIEILELAANTLIDRIADRIP